MKETNSDRNLPNKSVQKYQREASQVQRTLNIGVSPANKKPY